MKSAKIKHFSFLFHLISSFKLLYSSQSFFTSSFNILFYLLNRQIYLSAFLPLLFYLFRLHIYSNHLRFSIQKPDCFYAMQWKLSMLVPFVTANPFSFDSFSISYCNGSCSLSSKFLTFPLALSFQRV